MVSRWKALAALLLAAMLPGKPALAAPPESFQYAVEWRLISAGIAKLSWSPTPRPAATGGNGSEIHLRLESTGIVSRLFRVEDDYRSTLGPNLCAENSFITAKEGSRNRETRVTFDPKAGKASWLEKDLQKNQTATREVDIPSCVHDVLGGLMALRGLRLEPGKSARLPISDGKKSIQARIEALDREDIKTPLGKFRTVRYEVFLFNDVLYKRPGHLHIWLSDDERRIPVQIQARMQFTIGTITFQITKDEANAAPTAGEGKK